MWVAKYWAQARLQHKISARKQKNSQITIKRLGWSNTSQEEAQQLAEQRAHDAMQQALADPGSADCALRQEHPPEVGYNGADGLPIREEVVDVRGDVAITRNSYGALCLNTPDVMFLDIDDDYEVCGDVSPGIFKTLWMVLALPIGLFFLYGIVHGYLNPVIDNCNRLKEPSLIWTIVQAAVCIFVAILAAGLIMFLLVGAYNYVYNKLFPPLKRIDIFMKENPQWRINVYRTAAGYRVLVLHQKFDPADEKVWMALKKLGIDPVYQRMCQLQKCFRARLTPKPWRMGIQDHIAAGRRAWYAHYAYDLARIKWVNQYDNRAQSYATCHLIKQYGKGSNAVEQDIEQVVQWHDQVCKAHSQLPLA